MTPVQYYRIKELYRLQFLVCHNNVKGSVQSSFAITMLRAQFIPRSFAITTLRAQFIPRLT